MGYSSSFGRFISIKVSSLPCLYPLFFLVVLSDLQKGIPDKCGMFHPSFLPPTPLFSEDLPPLSRVSSAARKIYHFD